MKPTIKFTQFPGGEPHVQLSHPHGILGIGDEVNITARIRSWNDLGRLAVLNDALRRLEWVQWIDVVIPYFPGARQDRVASRGESLTVKVYADFINSLGFNKVTIADPHSDVTPALIKGVVVHGLRELLNSKQFEICEDFDIIVSPDAGATKRLHGLFEMPTVQCTKHRDTATGRLSEFAVHADTLEGKRCLIVDDICDGGGTFIALAEKLRAKGAAYVGLYVTHGIFSKNLAPLFNGGIDRVITTNSFRERYEEYEHYGAEKFSVIEYFEQDDINGH